MTGTNVYDNYAQRGAVEQHPQRAENDYCLFRIATIITNIISGLANC